MMGRYSSLQTCRFYSTTNMIKATAIEEARTPIMQLQYMVNMARVKINLPGRGDSWFFIDQDATVRDFSKLVKEEDPEISNLEIVSGKPSSGSSKALAQNDMLFDVLEDRTAPIYLKLNDMLYKFDSARDANQAGIDLIETDHWYDECRNAGLANLHSSTISNILKNVEMNVEFVQSTPKGKSKTISEDETETKTTSGKKRKYYPRRTTDVDNVLSIFAEQVKFFENDIIRQQIYKLKTMHLLTK